MSESGEWQSTSIALAYDRAANAVAKLWAQRNALFHDRLDLVHSLLPAGARLIDVGCGFGRDVAWFQERGFNAVGVDVSEGMVRQGHSMYENLSLFVEDFFGPSPPRFDAVECCWCRGVLFHIPHQRQRAALQRLSVSVVPGGLVYLQVGKGDGTEYRCVAGTPVLAPYAYSTREELVQWAAEAALVVEVDLSSDSEHVLIFRKNSR